MQRADAPLIAGLISALCGAATAAQAQSGSSDIAKTYKGEAWAGAETAGKSWSVHTGATWAPFGSLNDSGFRVRAVGGVGGYSYKFKTSPSDLNAQAFGETPPDSILLGTGTSATRTGSTNETAQKILTKGQTRFADVLAGYQWSQGNLTLKAFAGASFVVDAVSPVDPYATWTGTFEGAKVVVEAWYNINPSLWTAIDLDYATIAHSYRARARIGWRVLPHWSIGLDAGARRFRDTGARLIGDGYENVIAVRIGGLLRYDWDGGEVSLTVGHTFDHATPGIAGQGLKRHWISGDPFASVTVLMKF
jgi:Cellulose biosynthesis protein BcsS